jgi:hypothetical protein
MTHLKSVGEPPHLRPNMFAKKTRIYDLAMQRWTPFSPPLRLVIQRVITYSTIPNTGYVRKCQVLSRGRTAEEAELPPRYPAATLLTWWPDG